MSARHTNLTCAKGRAETGLKMKNTEMKLPDGWEYKDNFEEVFLNKYGYYELREKAPRDERKTYFEDSYFQEYSGATYEKVEYPPQELKFMHNQIEERAYVIGQNLAKTGAGEDYSLLDIGCGEGFLLQYFHDKGKKVKGIDIGSYALEHYHPDMLPFFEKGEIETLIPEMTARGERYDVINMDRTLNMVYDADQCIELVKGLMTERSILIIKVANDYSYLQQSLLERRKLQKEYWLDAPNQTRYFNRKGLLCLLDAHGFECVDFYGDTFVDFQLINPFSNYYEKPETGKAAHGTIVRLQNMFHDISMERTVEIYRMLGEMGFGREIVGIFKKKPTDGV